MKRWMACALMAASVQMGSIAHAQPTDEARSHFSRAVELFKEGDFRAALIEFQRAYDAAPNYKVLYNLGQTSLELQDYAGALKALRGYLDGGGREVPAARRAQVEADLKKLDSRVARVDITVNVEGADITIDDAVVGKSPLPAPILIGSGRRKIGASKSGLASATRVLDIAGGDHPKVSLELVEAGNTVVMQTPTGNGEDTHPTIILQQAPHETPPPKSSGPATGFWISLVATGAFAGATGILGALALVSKNDFDAKVGQFGVQTSQVDGARDQTRAFALATDIAGGCAIVFAVTTVILGFTTTGKKEARPHTSLVVGPTGGALVGTFE